MNNDKLIRTIHPEVRIIDEGEGLVDYVASDESIDSYQEIIRAKGWKFNLFKKNAPFVDSHNYWSIDKLLGKVVDFRVEGKKLIERVKWAVDVEGAELARIGFDMTAKGYLKAVSVGFFPKKWISQSTGDKDRWSQQLKELDLSEEQSPRTIYLEQEQIELSACVIGANPNALAKAFKDGAVSEEQLERLSKEHEARYFRALQATPPDHVGRASLDRDRSAFLKTFNLIVNDITS